MGTKTVLLLARYGVVIDDIPDLRAMTDIDFLSGSQLADVQAAFARTRVDHVVMGAGIDDDTRLQIVREVLQSQSTTLHLKDRASGPQGFGPFATSVLRGLADYPPER